MLENKIKQIKKINPEKIIYPALLLGYFVIIGFILFFSVKFFNQQLNLILAADDQLTAAQNQPALDLAGYDLLEKKFKLKPNVIKTESVAVIAPETGTSSTATSTLSASATTTPPRIENLSSTPLTISIINSTRIVGLAGKLKKILEVAGWPVAKIGNQSPTLATTTLNLSPALANHPDLTEIKSILEASGLEATENLLNQAGLYDLEIIIGNK